MMSESLSWGAVKLEIRSSWAFEGMFSSHCLTDAHYKEPLSYTGFKHTFIHSECLFLAQNPVENSNHCLSRTQGDILTSEHVNWDSIKKVRGYFCNQHHNLTVLPWVSPSSSPCSENKPFPVSQDLTLTPFLLLLQVFVALVFCLFSEPSSFFPPSFSLPWKHTQIFPILKTKWKQACLYPVFH